MAGKVKILDLPEKEVSGQDFLLVVSSDESHSKVKVKDVLALTEVIAVDTYEEMLPLMTGDTYKQVNVKSDTMYNEGDPSFYTYRPDAPEGERIFFLGLDNHYTEE